MAISLIRKRCGRSLPADIRIQAIQAHYIVSARSILETYTVFHKKKSNDWSRTFYSLLKVKIPVAYDPACHSPRYRHYKNSCTCALGDMDKNVLGSYACNSKTLNPNVHQLCSG